MGSTNMVTVCLLLTVYPHVSYLISLGLGWFGTALTGNVLLNPLALLVVNLFSVNPIVISILYKLNFF